MLDNAIPQAKLPEVYRSKNPKVVYHYTFEQSVDKIIEFGFDKHLSGQGSVKRLRHDKRPKIKLDRYVQWVENIPENKVINTCIDPTKMHCGDHLLRIALKPETKLLDARSVNELANGKWSKMLAYARQNHYHGVLDGNFVLLFSNKSIEQIVEQNY